MVHGIILCQHLTPFRFIPNASVKLCVARQGNPPSSVPILSHARFDAPPNAQVTLASTAACCAAAALDNYCCAHTVLPTTAALLLHHTAHRPLLHYYTAPYSTPLVTPTSAAPCNRCCTDHCCTDHCCTSHAAPYIGVSPNNHNHSVANFSSLPQIIPSLALLFFSPIVTTAHAFPPYNNFSAL